VKLLIQAYDTKIREEAIATKETEKQKLKIEKAKVKGSPKETSETSHKPEAENKPDSASKSKKPARVVEDRTLPQGWKTETREIQSGKKAGKTVKVYISPEGITLRSWPEVQAHLVGEVKPARKPTAKKPKAGGKKGLVSGVETVGDRPDEERDFKYNEQRIRNAMPYKSGDEDDLCFVCSNGGNVICCDGCDRVYHANCLDEDQKKSQAEDTAFYCLECMNKHTTECVWCGKSSDSESRLLLCSTCPRSFHYACLTSHKSIEVGTPQPPPQMSLGPDGAWQCQVCISQAGECSASIDESEAVLSQILELCGKLPANHCASVFGSRVTNTLAIECEYQKMRETTGKKTKLPLFCSGTLEVGGEVSRGSARLHHQLMEIKYGHDPEGETLRAKGLPRSIENSCDQWQTFLSRVSGAEEDICREGIVENLPPVELQQQFLEQGLCTLNEGLTPDQVEASHNEVLQYFDDVMFTLTQLELQEDLANGGFTTFKIRDAGRYDMVIPSFNTDKFSWFNKEAPWLPAVQRILGKDCVKIQHACILSLPDSARQQWHSDGNHVDDMFYLPPHCVNVFIPLVDLIAENGPTEFVPTTQLDWGSTTRPLILTGKAGQCIIFDHRIKHRGLANRTSTARPLVYITYAKPWYADLNNSELAGYGKLPPLVTRYGRGDDATRNRGASGSKRKWPFQPEPVSS